MFAAPMFRHMPRCRPVCQGDDSSTEPGDCADWDSQLTGILFPSEGFPLLAGAIGNDLPGVGNDFNSPDVLNNG